MKVKNKRIKEKRGRTGQWREVIRRRKIKKRIREREERGKEIEERK